MSSSATSKKPKQQQQQQNRPATPGKRRRGRQSVAEPASITQKQAAPAAPGGGKRAADPLPTPGKRARMVPAGPAAAPASTKKKQAAPGQAAPASFTKKQAAPAASSSSPSTTAAFQEEPPALITQKQAGPSFLPPVRRRPTPGEGYYADADWMALAINWSRTASQVRRQRLSDVPPLPLRVDEVKVGGWKCEELAGGWGPRVHAGHRVWVRYAVCRRSDAVVTAAEDCALVHCSDTTLKKGVFMSMQKTEVGGVTRSRFRRELCGKKKAHKARSFAARVPSAEVEGDVLEAIVWVLGREGGQNHTDELGSSKQG
ncbi:hypothetical protein HDU89_003024 [Geranomyces variabilis]|nr:hypothetical protein HDU89_003024 [Geranomyces variabilis]